MELIEDGIRKIFLQLSVFIYKEIANFYEIFERLCKSRILDTDTLNSISQRVGMLLGIIMLFIVSFSIIQMILEPDKLTDKEKGIGNIAKKIIMVIVMLGTSSAIFNMLYGVQTTIIESKIISKFLLPYYVESKHFGGVLSSELFTTFFKSQDKNYDDDIENLKMDIIETNSYHIAYEIVNKRDMYNGVLIDFGDLVIDWNWFLCPLFGGFVLYIIFTYCITVGTRTIQLAFLEIISPAAIISYLSPKKDTMFEKWWKIYFATYLDALIRIMIINLAVFLISALLDKDFSITFWDSVGGENLSGSTWIKIFMILAILTFAKKAPDLLKDLFPAGASKLGLGVSSPKKLFDGMLGGNLLNKGYDKVRGAAKAIGLMPLNGAKRFITGMDSAAHGKGFANGFWKNPSKLGQWVNKQRETFTPEGYKAYKEGKEAKEYVKSTGNSWLRGVDVAKRLMATGNFGAINNQDNKPNFLSAFDGITEENYIAAFRSKEFALAKLDADKASNWQEDIQSAIAKFKQNPTWDKLEIRGADGKKQTIYRKDDLEDLLRKATKAKDSTSNHLTQISKLKENREDARDLEGWKLMKGNETNPVDSSNDYESVGIKVKASNQDNQIPGQMRMDGF